VRRPWPTVTPSDVDRAESDAEETPALTHQLSLTLWTRTRPSTTDGAPPAAARLKAQEGGTGRRGTAGAGGRRPRCLMSLQRPWPCSHAAMQPTSKQPAQAQASASALLDASRTISERALQPAGNRAFTRHFFRNPPSLQSAIFPAAATGPSVLLPACCVPAGAPLPPLSKPRRRC
jgi:hypothetical protein